MTADASDPCIRIWFFRWNMGTFTGSKMQKSNHYRLYHTVLIGWNEQLSLLLEPCTTSLGVLIKYGFMIKIVASISSKIFAWTKHLTFFDSDTLVIFHWICRLQRCFWTQMFKEGKLNRCENDEALCMSNDANDTLTYYTLMQNSIFLQKFQFLCRPFWTNI